MNHTKVKGNDKDSAPIIFIHYGFSEYLPYTFKVAKLYNPEKTIVLLGDNKNKHLEKYGIIHENFEDYLDSEEAKIFNKVFKIVAPDGYEIRGKDNGKTAEDKGYYWTKFVFLKLFAIYNYVKKNNLEKFWTFDSDNLIVSDLKKLESRYSVFDSTEQNGGKSMQGLISNVSVLKQYLDFINQIFLDEEYLEGIKRGLENAPKHYAFTEMAAYVEFKNNVKINSFHLQQPLENEIFDDAICFKDGKEMIDYRVKGMDRIKKIFTNGNGEFFFKHENDDLYIKVNGLDCSWLPTFVYRCIYEEIKKGKKSVNTPLYEIKISESLLEKIVRAYRFYFK